MTDQNPSVRTVNMGRRRDRILDQARLMIAAGGLDAFNIRKLAEGAQVTVPTVYNLVGNKQAVVVALCVEALEAIEARWASHHADAPLARAEAVITESVGLFAEDESYYRAALLALEYLNQSAVHHGEVFDIYRRGEALIAAGCSACVDARLLRGHIPVEQYGRQVLRAFRTSYHEWALGHISIDAFRREALSDIYTILAADAVETFRVTLLNKIAALNIGATTAAEQHHTQGKE
tara:strand:+ start:291 stop:995 length:705 start_codon:yes stop_codon:yes gene_type:complete